MRTTALVLVVLGGLVAGCGGEEPASDTHAWLDLPVVGTVGDEPPANRRVTIDVTRDGHIRVPGEEEALSLPALLRWLDETTKDRDEVLHAPDGSSLLAAFLRIDAATPWGIVQSVAMACAHPSVKIWELAFAAQTPAGERGAVHLSLPKDGKAPPPEAIEPTYRRIKVFMLDGDREPSGFGTLQSLLPTLPLVETGSAVAYDIVTPPPNGARVPYQAIMSILDVCFATGSEHVFLEGAPITTRDALGRDAQRLAEHIAMLKAQGGVLSIRVGQDRTWLGPDASGVTAGTSRGRVRGRWGTSRTALGLWEEVVEEVLEEVEEDD